MLCYYLKNRPVGLFINLEVNISQNNITRDRILNTALELITKNGFDATGVADICQVAKVSKGAFYHHFPSKQALFLELMQKWLNALDIGFHSASHSASNVPDSLLTMAGMTGSIFQEAQTRFPILLEFWRQASLDPLIWKETITPYHKYMAYFENLVNTGISEGAFDSSVDPKIAARLLISLAMGFLLQASFDPESVSWDEATKSGMRIILNGLRRSP